jgi:hypothetical protein
MSSLRRVKCQHGTSDRQTEILVEKQINGVKHRGTETAE